MPKGRINPRLFSSALLCAVLLLLMFDTKTGYAAISVVTATGTTSFGTTLTSYPITSPAGTTTGDLLICAVAARIGSDIVTGVANGANAFTQLTAKTSSSYALISIWYRVVQPGDPSTWTVSLSTTGYVSIITMAYRGVDNSTPIDAQGTAFLSTGSDTVTFNSLTTTQPNAWFVGAVAINGDPASLTTPMDLTSRGDIGNGGAVGKRQECGLGDIIVPTAGTAGPYIGTYTNASSGGVSYTFALRPAAGGGGGGSSNTTAQIGSATFSNVIFQ